MKTQQIGFACALGAFIGTLISIEIREQLMFGYLIYPAGFLAGGFIGYLAYDFRAVGQAFQYAFHRVTNPVFLRLLKALIVGAFGFGMFFATIVLYFVILLKLFGCTVSFANLIRAYIGIQCVMSFLFFMVGGLEQLEQLDFYKAFPSGLDLEDDIKKVIYYINPISFPFTVIYFTAKGAWFILVHVPQIISAIIHGIAVGVTTSWKIVRLTFIYIHSSERVLCFADSVIGAIVGYHFGNAIIGAIAGAFLGIANFKIVSVRWLKLIPQRA
jgi:hypothetical protein